MHNTDTSMIKFNHLLNVILNVLSISICSLIKFYYFHFYSLSISIMGRKVRQQTCAHVMVPFFLLLARPCLALADHCIAFAMPCRGDTRPARDSKLTLKLLSQRLITPNYVVRPSFGRVRVACNARPDGTRSAFSFLNSVRISSRARTRVLLVKWLI